jgi:hypothetical protein
MAILNFGKRITSGFGLRLIRRNAMGQRSMLVIFAASVLFGSILPLGNAVGQSAKDVVGSYTLVSVANVQDGKKYEPYGPNPKGMMRLEHNGRYVVVLIRPDLPKLASNDRNAGTLEEYKAIALGSFFHLGTYTVGDGHIIFRLENVSFPNWNGQEQKRKLTVTGDELKYEVGSTLGGTSTLVWKQIR